jgi:hypothetical protein
MERETLIQRDNQAMAQTLDYLRQSNHKEHVIAARLFSELQTERARLRDAIMEMSHCNLHTGDGPHCACSQRERETIASTVLGRYGHPA